MVHQSWRHHPSSWCLLPQEFNVIINKHYRSRSQNHMKLRICRNFSVLFMLRKSDATILIADRDAIITTAMRGSCWIIGTDRDFFICSLRFYLRAGETSFVGKSKFEFHDCKYLKHKKGFNEVSPQKFDIVKNTKVWEREWSLETLNDDQWSSWGLCLVF